MAVLWHHPFRSRVLSSGVVFLKESRDVQPDRAAVLGEGPTLLLLGGAAANTGEPAPLWSKSIHGDRAAPQGVGAGT